MDGLGSRMIFNSYIPSPFVVEALECLQAVQMGLDLGIKSVEVEGDALSIIKKLCAVHEDRSVISAYIKDSKPLSEAYNMCIFKITSMKENNLAHLFSIESSSAKIDEMIRWMQETGPVIQEFARQNNMRIPNYPQDMFGPTHLEHEEDEQKSEEQKGSENEEGEGN
ncbi:hypothetical protein Goshw_003162 [Gossypium schwendimanii]|uniref:RNase H type-1 domain-containing protein n=1 Tax=Gossypium schwendimanii TaxID=34291 RepID=A0A7J9L7I3_GOSSC|nr:hypothetical protein [Gossypium schwendimanii]